MPQLLTAPSGLLHLLQRAAWHMWALYGQHMLCSSVSQATAYPRGLSPAAHASGCMPCFRDLTAKPQTFQVNCFQQSYTCCLNSFISKRFDSYTVQVELCRMLLLVPKSCLCLLHPSSGQHVTHARCRCKIHMHRKHMHSVGQVASVLFGFDCLQN